MKSVIVAMTAWLLPAGSRKSSSRAFPPLFLWQKLLLQDVICTSASCLALSQSTPGIWQIEINLLDEEQGKPSNKTKRTNDNG
jgi:predicted component of type VI protein secretion system